MIINDKGNFELTDGERKTFGKLGESADFKVFQKSVEDYVTLLLKQFLDGTEKEKGSAGEEFYKLRAFRYYFKKFIKLTQKDEVGK